MIKEQQQLLDWYKKSSESMPWRETSDPYKIWISEIMLQQTQVTTAKDYYIAWITKLPAVEDVANSSIDDLLKLWEGLGYYRRVHNIHKTAKMIVNHHSGLIPESYDKLTKLKGIGDYTASAILSIAFNQVYPAIDGNVKRIFSRIYKTNNVKKIYNKAQNQIKHLMDGTTPGDITQSLMDLGRDICTPSSPNCIQCPFSKNCLAFINNKTTLYPKKSAKQKKPHYDVVVGMIYKADKFLISQRHNKGLLGGLWELPGGKKNKNEKNQECLKREIKEELGILIDVGEKIGEVQHVYSHFKINLLGYTCKHKKGNPKPLASQKIKWVDLKSINDFAFPRSTIKLLSLIEGVA